MSTFFAAYDALCEEGLASTVTKSLTEIADTSLPGSFLPQILFFPICSSFCWSAFFGIVSGLQSEFAVVVEETVVGATT